LTSPISQYRPLSRKNRARQAARRSKGDKKRGTHRTDKSALTPPGLLLWLLIDFNFENLHGKLLVPTRGRSVSAGFPGIEMSTRYTPAGAVFHAALHPFRMSIELIS
jgi:hypothetical protein